MRPLQLLGIGALGCALASSPAAAAIPADSSAPPTKAHDGGGPMHHGPVPSGDAGAHDGGPARPAHRPFTENAAQQAKRHSYVTDTKRKIRDHIHRNAKDITTEEREAVRTHWNRAMRLWRIRAIAEDEKDGAVVRRVDAALERADRRLYDALDTLNAKAPVLDAGVVGDGGPHAHGPRVAGDGGKADGPKKEAGTP